MGTSHGQKNTILIQFNSRKICFQLGYAVTIKGAIKDKSSSQKYEPYENRFRYGSVLEYEYWKNYYA